VFGCSSARYGGRVSPCEEESLSATPHSLAGGANKDIEIFFFSIHSA